MIINTEELIAASSVSHSHGVVELELEECVKDSHMLTGEVIFMCLFCDSIVVAIGTVEKYEEIEPEPDLEQDIFSRLYIRGQSISFSVK